MPDKGKRNPQPSEKVLQALSAGATSFHGGLAAVHSWRYERRPNDRPSRFIDVYAGDRHVQVYVSPQGRSVRVFVDGTEA